MAILQSQEILDMSPEELDDKRVELLAELMKVNGVLASGGIPEDVGKVTEIKRTIARLLTIKKQKELNKKKK